MRFVFRLLFLVVGCAVTEPSTTGTIVGRCRIETDGSTISINQCPVNFYALCIAGSDAGNNQSFARCCPNSISNDECARRAGLTSDGGPPADR